MIEAGWLVECDSLSGPFYLSATTGLGSKGSWLWTYNHLGAVRFSRREDAQAIIDLFFSDRRCRAAEHAWG